MHPRRGFTLLELVVALTLLAVGLLAVAAGLGASARLVTDGRSATGAASLLQRRVARMRAEGCGPAGSEQEGAVRVSWGFHPAAGGRLALVVAERPVPRGIRVDSLTFFQRCP